MRRLPVTWLRDVVIRSEFPCFAEIAGVLCCPTFRWGCPVSWAHGVDRMGKDEWAGLPDRLAACLRSRKPVPGKQPTPLLCYFTGIEGSASQRYRARG